MKSLHHYDDNYDHDLLHYGFPFHDLDRHHHEHRTQVHDLDYQLDHVHLNDLYYVHGLNHSHDHYRHIFHLYAQLSQLVLASHYYDLDQPHYGFPSRDLIRYHPEYHKQVHDLGYLHDLDHPNGLCYVHVLNHSHDHYRHIFHYYVLLFQYVLA